MKSLASSLVVICLAAAWARAQTVIYEPTWESLDARPNPPWFDEAKFGIFIHWGVYSVPAWGPKDQYSEWYWHSMNQKNDPTGVFHAATYGAGFTYQDFAPMFKAELFDPDHWAEVFRRSGAKYIVHTSKHHEGFCMWPSAESWNWNSVDVGPHRDLLGDLTKAVRDKGLRMGYYYSFYEWYNPIYRGDVRRYVDEHMLPQLKDLVTRYEPDILWPDGEWEHDSDVWRSREFLTWLFNESPVKEKVAINDRWGKDCRSRHGGFWTTEYMKHHQIESLAGAKKWEECRGMGKSFGFNRNETAEDYLSATQLIHMLVKVVSQGGNLLLDIGPTADGRIPVIMEERLLQMGDWLGVNGEAIFGTQPSALASGHERICYTRKGNTLYVICLDWPGPLLELDLPAPTGPISLLGHDETLKCEDRNSRLAIGVPSLTIDRLPCHHAWVIKMPGAAGSRPSTRHD